jgi:hypothetical protein
MNPRSVKNFLTSRFGAFVMFVIVLFSGLWLYGRSEVEERQTRRIASAKKPELGRVQMPLDAGLENGVPQPTGATGAETKGEGRIVPLRLPAESPAPATAAAKPTGSTKPARKIKYQTLLAAYTPTATQREDVAPPKRFVPYGTLLKCKLVNTVDSANLETPVIALLLEDVWQNGERVLPANTLVHGTARAGRIRDRITVNGVWHLVWQDGRELTFNGVALDREYEHDIDGYGITDGSAGLKWRVLATDDLQELKMLASAALSGLARGTQDRSHTAFGTTITGSLSNGVREGVGEVFDLYAHRTLREIEQNGYIVRVPAGKEFYVYVVETVTPESARIAGTRIKSESSEANPRPATPRPAPTTPSEPEPKEKG